MVNPPQPSVNGRVVAQAQEGSVEQGESSVEISHQGHAGSQAPPGEFGSRSLEEERLLEGLSGGTKVAVQEKGLAKSSMCWTPGRGSLDRLLEIDQSLFESTVAGQKTAANRMEGCTPGFHRLGSIQIHQSRFEIFHFGSNLRTEDPGIDVAF